MKLSLAVIAKDEVEQVKRIINDYGEYFDELAFAVDDQTALDTLTSLFPQAKFYKYEWCDDFAHKRNFLQSKLSGDYYVRIDTDDAIINPEKIRPLAEWAKEKDISVVMCYYVYSKDEDGNPNAVHYRETIIKNSPNIIWNKKIHECIIPVNPKGYQTYIDETIKIDHLIDFEHAQKSILRNLKYLIDEYNKDKENTDPRTIAYLGRTFFSFKEFDKAIFFLQKHIEKSGWAEDRYLSWCYLAEVFNHKKDYQKAIACTNEALAECPELPDAYFKLHDIYFQMGSWEKSIVWGEMGFLKPAPKTGIVLDPSAWTWRPALSMAYCYMQIGEVEKAYKFFNYARKLAPSIKWIKDNEKWFEKSYQDKKFAEDFVKVYKFYKDNYPKLLPKLAEAIPYDIDIPALINIRKFLIPPKVWQDNEICIFCMPSAEAWSPKSVETGIGGSEEAVIRIAEQLNKLGYKVTVYNDCLEEGDYDGVTYLDWKRFNLKDKFSTLISWRSHIFQYGALAKNRIIWLHDGIPDGFFTQDNLKLVDKIIVLSQYHKSLLPKIVPKEKIYVSANGLVPEDFEGINEQRDPHRIIWASSYDRGLETILRNWPKIRAEVPDATIHIFYGWETYDKLVAEGQRRSDFKPMMIELMKQEGVYEHGRIGHKELLKEYHKSGIMAYPCNYIGEIQCISLSKCIASGCIAVTNDFAVLPERNPYVVVKNEDFIAALINVLKNGVDKKVDTQQYIKDNSWEKIAKDWQRDLFKTDYPVILEDRIDWIRKIVPKDKKVVDIGSNKGHTFDDRDRTLITSVDLDKYDIPNFIQADAQNLPLEDKEFDIAVLAEILEHCPDPKKALSEAKRVAKEVVISVPYEHKWTSDLKPFQPQEKQLKETGRTAEEEARVANPAKEFYTQDNYQHLYHSHYFTPKDLETLIKEVGFKEYEICEIRRDTWVWIGAICKS